MLARLEVWQPVDLDHWMTLRLLIDAQRHYAQYCQLAEWGDASHSRDDGAHGHGGDSGGQ